MIITVLVLLIKPKRKEHGPDPEFHTESGLRFLPEWLNIEAQTVKVWSLDSLQPVSRKQTSHNVWSQGLRNSQRKALARIVEKFSILSYCPVQVAETQLREDLNKVYYFVLFNSFFSTVFSVKGLRQLKFYCLMLENFYCQAAKFGILVLHCSKLSVSQKRYWDPLKTFPVCYPTRGLRWTVGLEIVQDIRALVFDSRFPLHCTKGVPMRVQFLLNTRTPKKPCLLGERGKYFESKVLKPVSTSV